MVNTKSQNAQEKALRRYFLSGRQLKIPILLSSLAALCFYFGIQQGGHTALTLIEIGLLLAVIGCPWLIFRLRIWIPSDEEVDRMTREGIQKCLKCSYEKLDIRAPSGGGDYLEGSKVMRPDPQIVQTPLLRPTRGIPDVDRQLKVGKDKVVRFSAYELVVIHLEDYRMGIYRAFYNLLKDVALNEETREYYYQDVVSVSTAEDSTSYILPTGQKLTHTKVFNISVSSGESMGLAVTSSEISHIDKKAILPDSGADAAVKVIRMRMRDVRRPGSSSAAHV